MGLIDMMVYHKQRRDYFKWIFAIVVFVLGLMMTWSEAGGQTF